MSIRGFVLGVVLLALVGWCMVQETIKQTRARYLLADLARREGEMKENLGKLRTEEEAMRSPARLATLVREKKMRLVSLGSTRPASPGDARARMPGAVLDEEFAKVERPVRVASAGF